MEIDQAFALFIGTLLAEDCSQKTVEYYRYHVQKFINWLPTSRRLVGACQTSDVTGFINAERKRGMSKATIHGTYRALDGFFGWCEKSEEVGRPMSPLKNRDGKRVVKVKKPPQTQARRADVETVDALIDFLPTDSWICLRNRVALRLLRDTGIRLGEAVNAKLQDIDLERRILTIVESKNRKVRRVRFTTTLADEIRAYLQCRPACSPELANYLFVSAVNDDPANGVRGKLTNDGLRQMLTKLCRRAGLPHVNPHAIRHMFGTKALNDGIRLESVSQLMGHHDPSFTRRVYADLLDETVQGEYDAHWA